LVLSAGAALPTVDFWAFEVKINKWKRALFQAMQSKVFAARTVVVLPPDRERVLLANLAKFRNMKVGVMTFDASRQECRVLLAPPRTGGTSRFHYLFTLAQVLKAIDGPWHLRRPRPHGP